jgi:nucleoside-diphosphate-sugar epimerase
MNSRNHTKIVMKNIVITGALGHIGSQLIHSLLPGEFQRVLLIDNLLTQRYSSLFQLPTGVPFEFIEADICDANLESLFSGYDTVVHLAAITNAAGSFENATEVERVNLAGTERVARACAETNCRLIALSTTSVYGVSSGVVDEDCPAEQLKPQSPYAESKLQSERLLAELGRSESLKSVICRFGTIYGTSPGMRFHTAVNKFSWQACLGKPLTVWRAALDQQRPYLELGDAVRAIKLLLNTDDSGFDNGIYNVLTENATVRKVVACIRRYVPDVVVEEVDSPIMNQLSYTVSAENFRRRGFTSRGDLQTGINETIEWLRGARSGAEFALPGINAAAS